MTTADSEQVPTEGELAATLERAADPSTPLEDLAAIAYATPLARPAVAANPSTYPDLLVWLGQLGDDAVSAALRSRGGNADTGGPASDTGGEAGSGVRSPIATVRFAIARIPRPVLFTALASVVVIAIVAFTSIGLTAAAEGRLDAAVSAHEQAQAEAEAEQEREEEAQDPVEVPVDTPPAPPPASAGGHQIEWTDTTSLGYSITSTVTWGSVVRGTEGTPHPSSSGFTLGSGCGFEPTKDAYVAGVWTVTNSTETYALALQSQMSVQGRLSTPGVSVALEWNTSSGPNCGFSTLPYAASVESNSDIESGQSIRSPIFIIIKNYYSPTYPEGDVGDLANIKVTQGFLGGVNAPLG